MQSPDDRIEREIYESVSRGYEWLFESGQGQANWKLVDFTSMAAMALSIREPKNSPWMIAIRKWLISQQTELEPGIASWDENVSDTAFTVLALLRMGVLPSDEVISRALEFLHKIFHANGRPNWEDEPWETSWSIIAISESGDQNYLDEACQGARWLLGIQEGNGSIIAPHYTAYFVKVVHVLCKSQTQQGYCVMEEDKLRLGAKKAADYLMSIIDEETLWTGEAWSNGQILWALASSGHLPFDDLPTLNKIVNWFRRNQHPNGNWYDAEDTSCAIIGLLALLKGYLIHKTEGKPRQEDMDTVIYNHLRRMYEAPKLLLGRKFVEVLEDGTTTLSFSPMTVKVGVVLFAIASGLTVIIALWDFIREILGI